jgi:hypothetical protein
MEREKIKSLFVLSTVVLSTVVLSTVVFFGSASLAAPLDEIRAAIKQKGGRWVASETAVSVLPDHEKRLRVGLMKHTATGTERLLSLQPPITGSPVSVDWRNGNYVTAVKDQGNCGSCWAFATTAALESYVLINDGPLPPEDLAEEILVSCSTAGSCSGGYIDRASDFIRVTGLPTETYFPYTATSSDDSCTNAHQGWQSDTYRTASWSYVTITPASVDAIKTALSIHGPLVTTMDVYYDFFSYRTGVYEYATGTYQGGHAILIVGYTDDPSIHGGGYFTAKNSWGTGWGESGYFNIAYSQIGSPVYFGEWTIAYEQPAPAPTIPAPPSNLGAAVTSSSQINLSWTDASTNETGFKIERCLGPSCTNFGQIATVGANATSYSNAGLVANTSYTYRVRAYNANGDSSNSNTASAMTPAAPSLPATPSSLTATALSKTQINLSWSDNSNNETGFKIDRCRGSACTNFAQIYAAGANVNTYNDAGLSRNTKYRYRVRAYNTAGNSGYSNILGAGTVR